MALTKEQRENFFSEFPEAKRSPAEIARLETEKRDSDLMLLGYNQALLENGIPEGMTRDAVERAVKSLRAKLGK